jgi:hypothetical protein
LELDPPRGEDPWELLAWLFPLKPPLCAASGLWLA